MATLPLRDKSPVMTSHRYAVVCGLQYERHFSRELVFCENKSTPLFRIFPDSQIAWAGPWLISLADNQASEAELAELEAQSPAVSWIESPDDFDSLTRHLAEQLNIELENGDKALFRYYDPRVLAKVESILTTEQQREFMGKICSWRFLSGGEVRLLTPPADVEG